MIIPMFIHGDKDDGDSWKKTHERFYCMKCDKPFFVEVGKISEACDFDGCTCDKCRSL